MADTVDIGVEFPTLTRAALKGLHTRYRGGRLTTSWCYSGLTDAYVARALRRGIGKHFGSDRYDAAIMIDSIADLPQPFYSYYDSSWDLLMTGTDTLERYAAVRRITPANVRRRRDLQVAIYQRATGVFAESRWLARSLVEQSGIDPAKIHIAPPAIVAGRGDDSAHSIPDREGPRRKLLFVGRMYESYDFYRKGGDLVVRALNVLRRDYDPAITLTVVGMDAWPLPGGVPDGVDFRGVLPPSEVKKLYDSSDLFVMPSRMERLRPRLRRGAVSRAAVRRAQRLRDARDRDGRRFRGADQQGRRVRAGRRRGGGARGRPDLQELQGARGPRRRLLLLGAHRQRHDRGDRPGRLASVLTRPPPQAAPA